MQNEQTTGPDTAALRQQLRERAHRLYVIGDLEQAARILLELSSAATVQECQRSV